MLKFNALKADCHCCYLCGYSLDYSIKDPKDPLSPTIDHIVPLSKKGGNQKWNLKIAHKKCNSIKGNQELSSLIFIKSKYGIEKVLVGKGLIKNTVEILQKIRELQSDNSMDSKERGILLKLEKFIIQDAR